MYYHEETGNFGVDPVGAGAAGAYAPRLAGVAVTDGVDAFLWVAAMLIVTPGPDTALTIRNTLLGGRRGGVFTAIGISGGQATWALAASAGIAALVESSERAYIAVRTLGAAYLAFLGAQALLTAIRRRPPQAWVEVQAPQRLAPPVALRQGLVSNLANPKMAVFFTSVLPRFTPRGDASFSALFLLGAVFAGMALLWLIGYAFAVALAGDFLRRPRIRRLLEAVTGMTLLVLGLRMALERT